MIRLLIADNHTVVREGLKQIFSLAPDIEVAGEAENGEEALQRVRDGTFNLLLLEIIMPDVTGADLINHIRECRPDLPILVFSMHSEVRIATCALKAGACGFITKSSKPERLVEAVRKVSSGFKYIDPAIAEEIAMSSIIPSRFLPHSLLSDRELEVFNLLAKGKGGNEIARQLSISNKTVSTYKIQMMKKMNFSNVTDLVCYALQHEFIDKSIRG